MSDIDSILNSQNIKLLRWLVIILIAVSLLFLGQSIFNLVAITALAVLANVLIDYSNLKRSALHNHWFIVFVSFAYCALLISYTGGEASPYFALIFLLVIFASFFYTIRGALFSCLLANSFLVYIYSQAGIDLRDINIMLGLVMAGLLVAIISRQKDIQLNQAKLANKQYLRKDLQLSSLVNTITDAVFLLDNNGKILYYNGAALELVDTHLEIRNKYLSDIIKFYDGSKKRVDPVKLTLKSSKLFISDDIVISQAGKQLQLYVTSATIKTGSHSTGAVLMARDISAQKTLDMQKDEFLAVISHELRTPIAVVEADISTALMPKFAKIPIKTKKLLESAYYNLELLSNLLQDLSQLTKADQSLLDTEVKPIQVNSLLRGLVNDFKDQAAKSNINIKLVLARKLPSIMSSESRIREILVNYLTNAIKYGAEGKKVIIEAMPSDNIIGGIKFSVTDFGLGISREDQKNIYSKYFRADAIKAKHIKGTGIGLYITKKQADKLGAKVWFESQAGKGSTFYLEVASIIER